jgi:hypothetical protein
MKRAKKAKTKKAKLRKRAKQIPKTKNVKPPTKNNEIDLVSTVGILNTWRIQEYLDAIEARENVAWSDTPEGIKLFEEIRDELYDIRGWSLLQEILEAVFRPAHRKDRPQPDDAEAIDPSRR